MLTEFFFCLFVFVVCSFGFLFFFFVIHLIYGVLFVAISKDHLERNVTDHSSRPSSEKAWPQNIQMCDFRLLSIIKLLAKLVCEKIEQAMIFIHSLTRNLTKILILEVPDWKNLMPWEVIVLTVIVLWSFLLLARGNIRIFQSQSGGFWIA